MDALLPEQTQEQPLHGDQTKQLQVQVAGNDNQVYLRHRSRGREQLGHSVQLALHLFKGQAQGPVLN